MRRSVSREGYRGNKDDQTASWEGVKKTGEGVERTVWVGACR